MEDILLSQKKIQELLTKLDVLNEDVNSLKVKLVPEAGYISNHELVALLGVTNRTVQRWRSSGRLPFIKMGKKIYYRADIVMNSFKLLPNCPIEVEHPPPEDPGIQEDNPQTGCERCPLFVILNA
jgi:excisionase family DNA binding protein